MHNKRKYVCGLLLLAIIAAGGIHQYCQWGQSKTTTKAKLSSATVELGSIETVVLATGSLAAANKVDINSSIQAKIKEVKVKEGDCVTAGQVVVLLDYPEMQSSLNKAETALGFAQTRYQRMDQLYQKGAIAKQEYENAEKEYLLAKKDYENYAEQMKYIVITAPISGTVIGEPMLPGQTVINNAGSNPMSILTIADLTQMKVDVLIDENDIGKVKQGQSAQFTVDAHMDKTFTGQICKVAYTPTVKQNSNTVYYKVTLNIDNKENLLKPGMTARVKIIAAQKDNVLLIPLAAVKTMGNSKYVQVLEAGAQKDVPVQIGLCNEDQAEVIDGLTENQEVGLARVSQ